MNDTNASFGDVLRRLRMAAALSQEELAERAGLSRKGISDLERGARQTPRLETVRLLADALALKDDERAALYAAARPVHALTSLPGSPSSPSAAVPVPLTQLIGREVEVMALQTLLRDDAVRLVTLIGPGGIGKTRLAVAVASGLDDAFPDGIVFVELAPLTDAALVPTVLAQALDVRDVGGQPLTRALSEFLRSKALLLVLDNCEHVVGAAPELSQLLRAAPRLKILATSRSPLRLRGEREVPVQPLPVPDLAHHESAEHLAEYAAIRLFLARTRDVRPDIALTEETVRAIAAICVRLEGVPLAIELAATRVKFLSPTALLARLERQLPELIGGTRDAPPRQRTLRDTIAWSYELFPPAQQALLRHLSVFTGGIPLDAAEPVALPGGDGDIMQGMVALVDESLVQATAGPEGEPRFTMLSAVREFGWEALLAAGELEVVRARHAAWFLRLTEQAEQALEGPEQTTWLDRLEADRDNLRAAFAWFLERGDLEAALQMSRGLKLFWIQRGTLREARSLLERALAVAGDRPSPIRVKLLAELPWIDYIQWHVDEAEEIASRAMGEARAFGLEEIELLAGSQLAHIIALRGDFDQAAVLAEEVIARSGELGYDRAHLYARLVLARIEYARGNWERARAMFEGLLAHFRDV
ncbi:MAG: helix-turn-helix domain-containing protein, partial [Gemmatimonadota bacterium]|nr:helix-turn-helix domain-containing protein [Gemmatimonadota bacterium]